MEDKRKFWLSIIAKWNGSGRDIREFCRQEGISHSSMYYWRRKLGLLGQKACERFVPLEIEPIETSLPDARWLGDFVGSLLRGMR